MDEFTVIARARGFIRKVNPTGPSALIDAYIKEANARVKRDKSMGPDEAGSSFETNGSHFISVNGNDKPERQNFTICHELAHIILGLPSEHDTPWWSYAQALPERGRMRRVRCGIVVAVSFVQATCRCRSVWIQGD